MKNLWMFAFLVLGSLLFACADAHMGIYHYTRMMPYEPELATVYPVYVDSLYGEADQLAIADAIDQWNYVLNGHVRLIIVDTHFDMDPDILRRVVGGQAFAILRITGDNPMVKRADEIVDETNHHGPNSYSLGFTPSVGSHTVYLVRDRIKENSMVKGLIMHELGHSLGADHVGDGLMFPHYDPVRFQCVDYDTAKAVAAYQHWDVKTLNYCTVGAADNSKSGGKRLVDSLGEDNQRLQPPVDVIGR